MSLWLFNPKPPPQLWPLRSLFQSTGCLKYFGTALAIPEVFGFRLKWFQSQEIGIGRVALHVEWILLLPFNFLILLYIYCLSQSMWTRIVFIFRLLQPCSSASTTVTPLTESQVSQRIRRQWSGRAAVSNSVHKVLISLDRLVYVMHTWMPICESHMHHI